MTNIKTETLESTHRIRIESLHTPVVIQIWKADSSKSYTTTASHAIHTPCQHHPYADDGIYFDPASALRKAIDAFDLYYTQAVAEGHKPDESWLVPVVA